MTTKAKPAASVTTAITIPAPTVLTMGQLPRNVTLYGIGHTVFAQAAVLMRHGFIFDPDRFPEIFPATGHAFLHLTIGTPEPLAFEGAKEAADQALAKEHAEFEQRVQDAAKYLVADQARAAAKAVNDAKIAEAEAELQRLKTAAAA